MIFREINKHFFCFLILISVVMAFLLFNVSALAVSDPKSEGLTISPPISDLSLKVGERVTRSIKITNPTSKTIEVYPKVMDFKAKGEGGEPAFYDASMEDSNFSLSKWVSFTQSKIALTPQQVVDFQYNIDVPAPAEPGGHYGVMFFASEPPKSEADASKVTLSSMVGSLLLVKVQGETVENGALESFSANKFFYFKNDVDFSTRIRNLGNIHFKPKGEITVKNIFGTEVDKINVNEAGGNILPDSVRKFDNKWKSNKFLLGLYTAKVYLVYGDSGKVLDESLKFVVVPWWIIIIKVIILIAILVLIILWIRKRRKKKRAQKSNKPDSGKIILR